MNFLKDIKNVSQVTQDHLRTITDAEEYTALLRHLSHPPVIPNDMAQRLLEIILSPITLNAIWPQGATLNVDISVPKASLDGERTLVHVSLLMNGPPVRTTQISGHVFNIPVLALSTAAADIADQAPAEFRMEIEIFPAQQRKRLSCSRRSRTERREELAPLPHATTVASMPASQPRPITVPRPAERRVKTLRPITSVAPPPNAVARVPGPPPAVPLKPRPVVQVMGAAMPPQAVEPMNTQEAVRQRMPSTPAVDPTAITPLSRPSSLPPVAQVPRPTPRTPLGAAGGYALRLATPKKEKTEQRTEEHPSSPHN